jgi:predicted porin
MIRKPIAAGVLLALAASCHAQQTGSNVTMFGVIDLDATYGKGSLTTLRALGNSGLAGSRLGVRGTEDLGGGLRASFVLEHGFAPDTGAATAVFWNRQTYVALGSAQAGDLSFGRQYTPTFMVHATYDAFGPQGAAAQQVLFGSMELGQPTNIRANNAINYATPANLGGFVLQAMVAAGEGAATGKHMGVRGGYAAGPLSFDLALGKYYDSSIGDLKTITLGGRYKLGNVTLYALHDRANSGTSNDTQGSQVSLSYALGATDLKASVAQSERKSAAGVANGTTRRYGVGAVHNLSKRTALYTSLAKLANSNGAGMVLNGATTAANQGSTGLDVGLKHTF